DFLVLDIDSEEDFEMMEFTHSFYCKKDKKLDEVYQTAKNGLQGWIDCFEKAALVKVLSGGGLNDPADTEANEKYLKAAYELGRNV
ncbi:MAG: hypothetical protein II729_03475, partial [Ruminococcus sp.]|nr:hypothetical protein [Ruminococcus sp.]